MTHTHEELLLDRDGIPVLTNPVRKEKTASNQADYSRSYTDGNSAEDIAARLLSSHTFMQHLDEIAEELSYTLREQVEKALQPVIAAAVSSALNDNTAASTIAVREQLEHALPDIIVSTLQDEL